MIWSLNDSDQRVLEYFRSHWPIDPLVSSVSHLVIMNEWSMLMKRGETCGIEMEMMRMNRMVMERWWWWIGWGWRDGDWDNIKMMMTAGMTMTVEMRRQGPRKGLWEWEYKGNYQEVLRERWGSTEGMFGEHQGKFREYRGKEREIWIFLNRETWTDIFLNDRVHRLQPVSVPSSIHYLCIHCWECGLWDYGRED